MTVSILEIVSILIRLIRFFYTYYYREKITKAEFIFANIEDFLYICQKRKEETL